MSKTILIIEDNLDIRENICEILELANYRVDTANNGKDGVHKAKTLIPDLIVCDIMMPIMDGYDVLYLLSKNEKTSNIPFIFLTAKAEKSDFRKGMNLGADDYLTKPFDEIDLLNAVESRLKRSETFKATFNGSTSQLNNFLDSAKGIEKLKSLTLNKTPKVYKKKEVLFHEGDYASFVLFISKGKVKTFKINDDAKEYTTGLFKNGDFIGYIPIIKNNAHSETALALEDTEVYRINKEDFIKLLYTNQEVSKSLIKMISGNIVNKEQELLNLAYNSVRKRVADSLILLQNKYQENKQEEFAISISRDDLASIVGTSTESVIRVLSDFKEDNLIKVKGRHITILENEQLEKIIQ